MCRLAGIIDKSNKNLKQDILAMRDAMRHGGPDAEGVFVDEAAGLAFGHRRLSLIDLSDAGNQPMHREDVSIVFNGEIYNYRELRQELKTKGQHFSTDSDTEVIIRAYQHWGTECFGRFRGMFAIAIYDRFYNKVLLARDHAGIKPLYFHHKNGRLYFSSEIRGLKALSRKWEERSDWRVFFLTYGFLPEPITTLKDVQPLEKGSYRVFDLADMSSFQRFFYREEYSELITDLEAAKKLIRDTLTATVQRHLISDAPIGLFLSGGIDSSLLTLIAQPFIPNSLHTLSMVFEDQEFSEKAYQDIIIEKTDAHHQSFLVTKKDFDESFDDIILSMDQPSTDGINSYFICKYARKAGLKAVLSGLGADELLGGYPSFKRERQYRQLSKIPRRALRLAGLSPKDAYRKLSFLGRKDPVGEYLFYRGYYSPKETALMLDCSLKEVNESLSEVKVPSFVANLSAGNRVSYLESNIYMQSQLLKDTDAMSMWHSVEVRVPFLGKDFIEAVHKISETLKFGHQQPKHLLIESFKDILPTEIWDRKKQGFVLPFANWMKGKQLSPKSTPGSIVATLQKRFDKGKLVWSRYWAYLLISEEMKVNGWQVNDPVVTVSSNGRLTSLSKDKGFDSERIARQKVLFLCLTTFSQAGGIEKFNRCLLKALHETEEEGSLLTNAMSPYDHLADETYFPQDKYKGFQGKRLRFVLYALMNAALKDTVIVGHLNLAPVGCLIKKFFPKTKLILITHGIEVWSPLEGQRKKMLEVSDLILSVSNFTKSKLIDIQGLPESKIKVFPNTIDPFFRVPKVFYVNKEIRREYNFSASDPVLFTLSRLSGREKYKGYDLVIQCLPELKKQFPTVRYIIAGKYDNEEKARLDNLITSLGLEENVFLTGYLAEKSLLEYYQTADLFIMPSRKEGFGIVFLEALICGLPVIGGNQDGSVDALRNGELGILVNPTSMSEIVDGITEVLIHKENYTDEYRLAMQQKTLQYFGFPAYKKRLQEILLGVQPVNRLVDKKVPVAQAATKPF
ncbi:MAG TPA: asparagine synthase (glutamine-hydrolyzing) [Flavipsychrobacter sp.]|nr:asparagine synthase (glutamine-hydrolyzing) [Flavipsychrobacter sp.]